MKQPGLKWHMQPTFYHLLLLYIFFFDKAEHSLLAFSSRTEPNIDFLGLKWRGCLQSICMYAFLSRIFKLFRVSKKSVNVIGHFLYHEQWRFPWIWGYLKTEQGCTYAICLFNLTSAARYWLDKGTQIPPVLQVSLASRLHLTVPRYCWNRTRYVLAKTQCLLVKPWRSISPTSWKIPPSPLMALKSDLLYVWFIGWCTFCFYRCYFGQCRSSV
jgi:hypothetical protein